MKASLLPYVVLTSVLLPAVLLAQVDTASLTGTVTDPSGAAVPNAQ